MGGLTSTDYWPGPDVDLESTLTGSYSVWDDWTVYTETKHRPRDFLFMEEGDDVFLFLHGRHGWIRKIVFLKDGGNNYSGKIRIVVEVHGGTHGWKSV